MDSTSGRSLPLSLSALVAANFFPLGPTTHPNAALPQGGINVTPMKLTRSALLAGITTATAFAGDISVTPEFKLALGKTNGAVTEITNKGLGFALTGSANIKLSETSSVIAGLGFRVLPGSQFIKENFTYSATHPTGYAPNSTFRAWNQKNDGEGFEVSALYRMNFDGLYVQGGLRVGSYKVVTRNTGTEYHTGATGSVNDAVGGGVSTIAYMTEKKTTSPAFVVGAGYLMAPNHAIEVNLSNLRLAGENTGTKNGLLLEFAYCMRF